MHTLAEVIATLDRNIATAEREPDSRQLQPDAQQQERMQKYVLVTSGKTRLAVPIEGLTEIGPLPKVTRLPNLPAWIHGIVNLRGEIVSVIDLQLLLTGEKAGSALLPRLAVLHHQGTKVGLNINSVLGTVIRPESDRVKLSDSALQSAAPSVFPAGLRVERDIFHILQPERFLKLKTLRNYYG